MSAEKHSYWIGATRNMSVIDAEAQHAIRIGDTYTLSLIVQNPATAADTLVMITHALWNLNDHHMMCGIALHKNTPDCLLFDLLEYGANRYAIWTYMAYNTRSPLPVKVIETLVTKGTEQVKYDLGLACRTDIPQELLSRLARDTSARVRRVALANDHISCDDLRRGAHDEDTDVRMVVAQNMKTPLETLMFLVVDEDTDVRFFAERSITMNWSVTQ